MTQVDSRARIRAAAKHELHEAGILGLRVQDVANRVGTSVSLIYKYFEDRDGLLAQVLGDMHNERIDHWETLFSHALSDSMPRGEYSVENLLSNLPLPNSNAFQSLGWDRVQMLAALKENPNPGLHRVISLVISSMNLIFINNDLLGDQRITDDEYTTFLQTYFSGFQR